eukprot:gb/GECH01001780.1/.p1 GENE.gb/GECH01001780.1/~~gb/GECH01001780.1/.p1  ORF type:complete len:408 (+),score=107.00 gb/GECH01001780.1/:1-1224(+)
MKTKEDFIFGEVLGEGAFSRVFLARLKGTNNEYAVKIIEKELLVRHEKQSTIRMEKEVLNKLRNHPNIVNLYATFQDKENLYFVLELAPGGELFTYISKSGPLTISAAKFYMAEIVTALEHMHRQGIVHRDMKPENVLLDRNMHVKLTDFGTAKMEGIECDRFAGTAEYVSPEVLKESRSVASSDLWALGCILYQMISGSPPFRGETQFLQFQQILNLEYSFPSDFPPDAQDLVRRLLKLNPSKRIGTEEQGGYSVLKSHPFFTGIPWHSLSTVTPPPLAPLELVSQLVRKSSQRRRKSSAPGSQGHPEWEGFLICNEKVEFSSLIIKKKGFSTKKRQLILTNFPRIIYVDPDRMQLKGQISWSSLLRVEKRSRANFDIITPKRVYQIQALDTSADEWARRIEGLSR